MNAVSESSLQNSQGTAFIEGLLGKGCTKMRKFQYRFTVEAPIASVIAFHEDARALKLLTPPPMFVQLHQVETLGEGSIAEFTLWFGPLPIKWRAIHSEVSENGFTDTQMEGPLKYWKHRHQFIKINENVTEIQEEIAYQYHTGLRGLINRIMFSKMSLVFLFTARKTLTRRNLKRVVMNDSISPNVLN